MPNEYIVQQTEEQEIFGNIWRKFEPTEELVRCKDCKYRSYYCVEATDGTTLYTCHHPCANDVPRPAEWFCADGKRRTDNA